MYTVTLYRVARKGPPKFLKTLTVVVGEKPAWGLVDRYTRILRLVTRKRLKVVCEIITL